MKTDTGNPSPKIATRILAWYKENRRDLPWRRTRDPYEIWIAEIMLQQTQVDTVIPYYLRFLKRFPDVETLAGAPLEDVLKAWENLGYYSRARNLHRAARLLSRETGGRIPASRDGLLKLPGIGAYTAGAILSFAFGQRVPAVDGNVKRVLCRVFAIQDPPDRGPIHGRLTALAEALVPQTDPSGFNQGLMDLGAAVCTPRNPDCASCPLIALCMGFREGLQKELPVRGPRSPLPQRQAVAALLLDPAGRLLVLQRPPRGLLGGLWKFPGGERAPGESLEKAAKRTVREETGLGIVVKKRLFAVTHTYSHFRLTLHVIRCALEGAGSRGQLGGGVRWAGKSDIEALAFSRAERKVLQTIEKGTSVDA